jgi:tellurite resistance-related uncharacterized protein
MIKAFIFITLLISSSISFAYIPRAQTIIRNMTRSNGSRDYKIVREVSLEADDKQIKAKETWSIANGDKMKVLVSSLDPNNPWNFVILYDSKNRTTLNSSHEKKTFKKSKEFIEPLFHDRSSSSLTKRLIESKFIPSWVKDTPAPAYLKGKTLMTPEPFISLEPMEGTVNYSIGAEKSSTGTQAQTHLWVEQDSFVITKARLGSGSEIVNTQFQTFIGGLKLPSEQIISWDNKVAKVKLLAVERTNLKNDAWSLDKKNGEIPSDPLIKEFYSRFR